MIIAVDNSFLCLLFNPNARPPTDRNTNAPLERVKDRLEAWLDEHIENGDDIIVPSPCLAELLADTPDMQKVIDAINQYSSMKIANFDVECAVEWGAITRKAIAQGDKKLGLQGAWEKIKFDRQIVVIAKVNSAEVFYTDDDNQTKFAKMLGMRVIHSWDLKVPPKQEALPIV